MFSPVERFMAFRYLRSRKQTKFVSVISAFSFLGIMLGVATLIIVTSVMNGFQDELIGRILGINGQLGVYPETGVALTHYEEAAERLSNTLHVQEVSPVVDGQAMASTQYASIGVMVRGMPAKSFKNHPVLFQGYHGLPIENFKERTMILGYRLALKLGINKGDTVTLISPKGNITAFGTIPKMQTYKVIGTFDSGMFEYDDNFVFVPLKEAQTFFMYPNAVSHLEVFLDDTSHTPKVLDAAADLMPQGARLKDWRYTNKAFFNAIEVEKNVMFLILTLIVIVAAFNMISGLIMLVQDKAKDIAILRTMGATRGTIMRVFLLAGLTIGVIGTLSGVGLGLLFCTHIDAIKTFLENVSGHELFSAEIYFLSHLPAKVDPQEVILITAMALTFSLGATLYPAWKASKTDPVEILRYE